MANPWLPPHGSSAPSPPRLTTSESLPPPLPPDPPDPNDPLSLSRFPPLGTPLPKPIRTSLQTAKFQRPVGKSPASRTAVAITSGGSAPKSSVASGSANFRSGNTVHSNHGNFKVLPPKFSSPIQTNMAAGASPKPSILPPLLAQPAPSLPLAPNLNAQSPPSLTPPCSNPSSSCPPLAPLPPPLASSQQKPTASPINSNPCPETSSPPPQSSPLLEKIKQRENKTLQRLAPVSSSDKGVSRVLIPDSVFQKGAEIHKDFIICYFNGRPPPFNQIQGVLNHMWGKGRRVEIHTNPLSRSMLVRIPSEYLRQKILEKSVWYVGESMFQAVQWSSSAASSPPSLESIQIWAHLTGVPLNLRHTQGLSLVAGLVGDPRETDDFTINLVSLTLSHVKVAVDLTKPLPSVVEFIRENGEVVEVQVAYPWVPPTCSHCKELGHVSRNCLLLPPPPKTDLPAKKTSKSDLPPKKADKPSTSTPAKEKTVGSSINKEKQHMDPKATSVSDPSVADSSSTTLVPQPEPPNLPPPPPLFSPSPTPNPPVPLAISVVPPLISPYSFLPSPTDPLSPPDFFFAPSLKRPRPDPTAKSFPSFTAQLSFFSSSSTPSGPELPPPPALPSPGLPLSNPFSILAPDGSLHHEETLD
ncbi:proline-rich protein 36-like [Raphanus sativus]|uniref:Uncharacterized protein LOC108845444 n=1 Tax=Raphanus sativus TaxID=3726 RepID=A0A6J0MRI8_RAPSA|nr:uncharacterized protein LOC108845444 [Raphanus sativus]KAJ4907439.1 proline-rich protein 36-like [Raphanus sativus]